MNVHESAASSGNRKTTGSHSGEPGQSSAYEFPSVPPSLIVSPLPDTTSTALALMLTARIMEEHRQSTDLQLLSTAMLNAQLAADTHLRNTMAGILASHNRRNQEVNARHMFLSQQSQQHNMRVQHQMLLLLEQQEARQMPPNASATTTISISSSQSLETPLLLASPSAHFRGFESFPMILHRMLAELELIPQGKETASFHPDGKSFRIHDHCILEREVLPRFFPKMKSFSSFQRQLNLYAFVRVGGQAAGLECGSYHHDLFVRDFPALSCDMRRTKNKGKAKKLDKKVLLVAEG